MLEIIPVVIIVKYTIIWYFLNMEQSQKRKILLLVPAICIGFTIFYTETLICSCHDHDCIGEGCPVCMQIEAAGKFLNTMKLAGIFFFLAACLVFFAYSLKKHVVFQPCLLSLLGLKVRFNL